MSTTREIREKAAEILANNAARSCGLTGTRARWVVQQALTVFRSGGSLGWASMQAYKLAKDLAR